MALCEKNFECMSCNHKFTLELHPYQVSDVESAPCPECNELKLEMERYKANIEFGAPTIGYHAQSVKPPQDFRNFMEKIKKSSPGSNMNIL